MKDFGVKRILLQGVMTKTTMLIVKLQKHYGAWWSLQQVRTELESHAINSHDLEPVMLT